MRELKFRVWLHDRGYMETAHFDDGKWVSTDGIFSLEVGENDFIEQYTGAKDKNGKEIYEGDIMDDGNHICKIKWSEHTTAFEALNEYEDYESSVWFEAKYGEVIGNIHENPELLEEEK